MARFWISWYQPGKDYRSITFPPPKQILGCWCAGHSENRTILSAMVEAKDEDDARNIILQKDAWPDAGEQRFCESINEDYKPNDRFPLSDWMIPRFEKKAYQLGQNAAGETPEQIANYLLADLRIRFRGDNDGQLLCDSLSDSVIDALKESAIAAINSNKVIE